MTVQELEDQAAALARIMIRHQFAAAAEAGHPIDFGPGGPPQGDEEVASGFFCFLNRVVGRKQPPRPEAMMANIAAAVAGMVCDWKDIDALLEKLARTNLFVQEDPLEVEERVMFARWLQAAMRLKRAVGEVAPTPILILPNRS